MNKTNVYRRYIRSLLKLFAYEDAGRDDSDEAEALREQMIEPWYALTPEERKRMDGLAEDLKELRISRNKNWWKNLSEKKRHDGMMRIREVFDLKSANRFDEALDLIRKWKDIIVPQFAWHFRGSCWNFMDIPEVAVEFFREAARIDPHNEKFKGVYLAALKKTNFQEAQKIADKIMASPEDHDLTLVVYAADVEATSINENSAEAGEKKTLERTFALSSLLELVMQRLLGGEVREHGPAVVGMAGMLLSSCYVTLGRTEEAYGLLSFLIDKVEPDNALLYAARGKLNFPNADTSIKDLTRSIQLGIPMNWPFVWIATHQMEKGDYDAVKHTCQAAFKRPLVPKLRSELLELFAIAEASLGAQPDEVRELFQKAVAADIRNTRAVENLTKFEELVQDPTRSAGWRQEPLPLDPHPEIEEDTEYEDAFREEMELEEAA